MSSGGTSPVPAFLSARQKRLRTTVVPAVGAALLVTLLPMQAVALPPDPAKDEVPREELVLEELPDEKPVEGATRNAGLDSIAVEVPDDQDEAPAGTATPPEANTGVVSFGEPPAQPAAFASSAPTSTAVQAALEPVEDLPVRLGQAPGAEMPTGTWQVDVSARTAPESDGVDGTVVTVTAPATGSVPVSVQLDYAKYQNLYGADWASRLTFVQFPECYLSTPDLEECRTYEELETANDTKAKTITATVDTAADGTVTPTATPTVTARGSGVMQAAYVRSSDARQIAASGDKAVIGAVDSGTGHGGSFKATPLIASGKWAAGSSSGAFTWSYPLTVPPAPAGPTPQIAFDYNSQAVDGKTATSSPQASWIGEGWEYDPGHIERRYRTCKEDSKTTTAGTPNNTAKKDKTSDLCWVSYNAVMSLGGKTLELVRVGESNGVDVYRPQHDDGTRVERRTGGNNGDNDGEYWVVTATNGTKYYFGLNQVGGGHAETNSVLTVPVFGNHAGEPCHAATFATSRCNNDTSKQQAWHWGLDKVIDVHGNVMIVNWHRSANYYAVNKKFKTPEKYYRGGLPDSIEYGLREGALGATPAAKIDFLLHQRCFQDDATCASEKFDNTKDPASYRPWWDSPGNLNCKSDSKLCPAFPSFWNRLRLGGVTTYAHRPGTTGLVKVDNYLLNHSFPRDWYDTSPGLWLRSITRYGYRPGDTSGTVMSTAGVSFEPYVVGTGAAHPLSGYLKDKQLPNLVPRNSSDARPGFTRPRIGAIATEHGGEIEVTYKGGCKLQPTGVSENDNRGTCFPVRWSPDGELDKPAVAWFNKYVVHAVTETDRITGVSDRIAYRYDYKDAAWGKSDDEMIEPALRTYSEWRGYQQVAVSKGSKSGSPSATAPQTQSYSVTRYFRGVGGEVKDSKGAVTLVQDDAAPYAGMPAETITYDGAGGRVVKRTLNFPWSKQTASRTRPGLDPLLAHRTGIARTDEIKSVGSSWQAVRSLTEVDADHGLPVQLETVVVKPNGTGETLSDYTCARTDYVHNESANLIGLPKSIRSAATSCALLATADPATQLTGSTRTSYDDRSWGEDPVKGLPTTSAEIDGSGASHSVVTTMTYDPLGRPRKVTEPEVGVTETQYTPGDTGGPLTSVKIINAKGHTSVVTLDPGRGQALTATDANGNVLRHEYDAFGRLVKGWSAARSSGTQDPDVRISYQMAVATPTETRPSAVTVEALKDDGGYGREVTIYDGLMRPVQTQGEAHGPGRVITDTRYNDHGQVSEQTNPYLAKGDPVARQFKRVSDSLVPSMTRTRYDGLERPVRVTTLHGGAAKFYGITRYYDQSTYVMSPYGSAAPITNTWTDARGRVTQIQHYATTNSSSWRTTKYVYDARGNRSEVIDPAGNTWSYGYDARRRLTSSIDPDTGTTSFGYDAADRRVRTTDSRTTTYTTYDELSRVTAVREGSASAPPVKEFTYDSLPGGLGKAVASIRHDASGDYINRVTGYDHGYRATGREVVIPSNAMTTGLAGTYKYAYTYTPTGNPLSTTLPAAGGLAQEKVITRYNSDGLPESTSGHSWYTADVTYSPYGEVLRAVSGPQPYRVWTTNFIDEHTGRLQRSVTDRETANPHRIADQHYSYDDVGNITASARKLTDATPSTTDAPEATVSTWDNQCFTYDALGELVHAWTSNIPPAFNGTGCKSAGGATWGPRTDGVASSGPVTHAADNVSDTTTPDTALTDSLNGAAPAAGTVSTGDTAYWDSYTFDVIGNRTSLVKHDPVNATKNVRLDYSYGKTVNGNGTAPPTSTQPHTLAHVTSSATGGGSVYEYDSAGNTTVRDLPDSTQQLTWTPENRMATATVDGVTTKYVYDAEGNRVLESSPTGTTLYLGEAEITTAAGKVTHASRAYGHAGAPTVVRSTLNGATTGHKLAVLLTDHLGTAHTAVPLASGQHVVRRSFKPYGEARGVKPAWPNKRTYLGSGIDDIASGLTHLGAREYDASTGRFISADPLIDITDPLQMNGYAYSRNSPISHSDPTGLWFNLFRKIFEWRRMWIDRHDTAVNMRWLNLTARDILHNGGKGRVTTDRKSNMIKGGSYDHPGKRVGYADLIYWTDTTVYVWEIKHKGGDAEAQGPDQLKNYIRQLTKQLREKNDNRKVVAGFKFSTPMSSINQGNSREMITVSSSSKDAGIEVYSVTKIPQKKPDPKPQPEPVAEPVPQPAPQVAPTPAHPDTSPRNLPAETDSGPEWNWGGEWNVDAGQVATATGTAAVLILGTIFHAATGCATC